ncbi:acyltransferase [Leifsonia sp. H3M29-4]|uniref:acyltransferase n=1 Tax=Salinibacterium metalliresistens TaxID=3031321 RepID=UPI0023DCDAFC|nr:acyltransferase [Salinibacterium metalliresistens]MDF1479171.1 acyltransferase [Salinibacterium metalliresistens]
MSNPSRVHSTADVAASAEIAASARVWHYAQVREHAKLGENVIVGRGAYVGTGVEVGDNCKIQNYALVYEPASLANGVFIGPAVVLTNDHFPRAINADGTPKSADDWHPVGVEIREGASIGASATCVAPVTIGRWALVGSGSVVVKDVPDFALVVGSPARRVGWVGKAGLPLEPGNDDEWICPKTGDRYLETDGALREANL